MATFTTTFNELLEPGLLEILGRTFRRRPTEFDKILNIRTSRKNKETILQVAGLGLAQLKAEGDAITFDDPKQGSTITVQFSTKALGVSVSWEMFSDDLYGYMRQVTGELGDSLRETIEIDAMAPLNLATDSGTLIVDGLSLANASHTRLDGGAVQSNTVSASLSVAALRDMFVSFEKFKDDRGKQVLSRATKLVIGPDKMFLAKEILGPGKGAPFTNENQANVIAGMLQIVMSHYLTSTTNWHVLGDKHHLDFFWRVRPVFRSFDDQTTLAAKFSAAMRYGVKAIDWRGYFHSSASA